ncbi:hypothetical protein FDK38_000973 [Candidozyma auris]|nr:hypothetical protein FDK38_000973 [[Candida] auris]
MSEEIRLNDSKLGTKEYWDDFYKKEIENFNENDEDTGENWFDDSDAERRVIKFFIELIEADHFGDAKELSILDLGTGNGHFLFELNQEVCDQDVAVSLLNTGIDYSPQSINFAKTIAEKKYSDKSYNFEEVNFISKDCKYLEENAGKFDVIFDKGTLDAIALNNDPVKGFNGKIGVEVYPLQVIKLMKPGSLLIITSCNFTEDELTRVITSSQDRLSVQQKVEYPSFQFGGHKGSAICTIAFVKK